MSKKEAEESLDEKALRLLMLYAPIDVATATYEVQVERSKLPLMQMYKLFEQACWKNLPLLDKITAQRQEIIEVRRELSALKRESYLL